MVLLAAEGLPNAEIGRRVGMTRQTDRLAGVTHWSARLLPDHLAKSGTPVSFAEVARIWRDWGPQPHRIETFKFSTDPKLEAKIRDVVGLYLDPPATRSSSACPGTESRAQPRTGDHAH